MPSYRFCRPDDVPLLAAATNACFNVHFPGAEPATVEGLRREMKELQVWPSNSLVALAGDDPIAVLIGTKREHEVLVLRLGVRPDYLRQGHGGHILTSLSQKLAVLGPPRLVAEVPDDLPGPSGFFTALGYRREATYVDRTRPPGPVEGVPEELVIPVTAEELDDQGVLEVAVGVAWERGREALLGARESLSGTAVATPERLEAWMLHRERGGQVDVLAAGCRDAGRRDFFLGLLLRSLIGRTPLPVRLPRLADAEMAPALLEGLGFVAGRTWGRYSASATPA